jgi:phosphoribosylformylglycinamidine synthase subunit PurL
MDAPSLAFSAMTDQEVTGKLREHGIGLTVEEARKVEAMLGRAPSVVEAVIWGIQGSEHCSYKSSRRFLSVFHTAGKHVILGPGEDSGIVAVTDGPAGKRWGIVVSHESHNKPSQVVPFEGAATGIGGTVRDVACMGARVIGCMDMLRLGDPRNAQARGIAKEVVRGIAGYGNPLGVPNLGGDTAFDAGFNAQCLVNAVAIGIVREDEVIHSVVPEEAAKEKYDIILVGKPTDRSGFGGAAFASSTLQEEKKEQNTGAVQEPNPFLERHILLSTYALFDWLVASGNLPRVSFKDLGAGGVVCSSVEQVAARGFGAEVDLDKVHVSLPGLPPEVIGCAETQERFCWVCHPSLTQHILRHYNETWDLPSVAENARASVIGHVTEGGMYRLWHAGKVVCEAKSEDITSGLRYVRQTEAPDVSRPDAGVTCDGVSIAVPGGFTTDIATVFRAMLAHPNYASRHPLIRKYDKDVIGNTVIEPGEADASVIAPLRDLPAYVPEGVHPGWEADPLLDRTGVAFSAGGNSRYGKCSAYLQGAHAVAEAICNLAAVGATPRALTDCLNYANPEVPSQLGALEQGVQGIADTALTLTFGDEPVPVISGNVSLYNGAAAGVPVPPSAVVCGIGVLQDVSKAITMQLKAPGSSLYVVGMRKDERGASAYHEVLESLAGLSPDALLGLAVPSVEAGVLLPSIRLILDAIDRGLLRSCHDISDGGLLLALFEMTVPRRKIGGTIGMEVDCAPAAPGLRADAALFGQTPGFVLEVAPEHEQELMSLAKTIGASVTRIGTTTEVPRLTVKVGDLHVIDEPLDRLQQIWSGGLRELFGA